MSQPKILQALYYDAQRDNWDVRRPLDAKPFAPSPKSFTILNISLGLPSSQANAQALAKVQAEALSAAVNPEQLPHFVALLEVTDEANKAIRELPWIREAYSTTDLMTVNAPAMSKESATTINAFIEHGVALFWLHTVPVLSAEALTRCFRDNRPCLAVNSRQFCGSPATFVVAHCDPTNLDRKIAYLRDVIIRTSPSDGNASMYFFSNLGNAVPELVLENKVQIEAQRNLFGFSGDGGAGCVWIKSPRVAFVSSSPISTNSSVTGAFRFSDLHHYSMEASLVAASKTAPTVSVAPVKKPSPSQDAGRQTEGSSPQPNAVFPSTPTLTNTGGSNLPQPRTLSQQSANVSQEQQGKPLRTFSTKHGMNIRVRENTSEVLYDISPKFQRQEEAVKALNSGAFPWNADFVICQGRLLASLQVTTVDLPTFRSYMSTHEPPLTLTQRAEWLGRTTPGSNPPIKPTTPPSDVLISSASAAAAVGVVPPVAAMPLIFLTNPSTPTATNSLSFGPITSPHAAPLALSGRRRFWNMNRATLLYQVTPKEMIFDITQSVGVSPNALLHAVQRLNGNIDLKHGEHHHDPLSSYPHDYALLYCSERQAYWMISVVDVPCDIASCRAAATQLLVSKMSKDARR